MYKISANYKPVLAVRETEHAIVAIKNFFQTSLSTELNLTRVTAPLFVPSGRGINDDLNGVEEPVSFAVKDMGGQRMEIVQSLAKWKRLKVTEMGCKQGFGIYTDMNAIRPDETLDAIHSLYVDQWDWEKVIEKSERNNQMLEDTVRTIFKVIKHMEHQVWYKYPDAVKHLPDDIYFIDSEELLRLYPDKSPKERENLITKEKGCVFIKRIGQKLSNGEPHDKRAPDYDDWELNGDILFWFDWLDCALEISSMGIRVDEESLAKQLKLSNCEDRASLPYHSMLLKGELPYTIGGGIGQSRLCMLLLNRAHVGEVQSSIWPKEMIETCAKSKIRLL